MTFVARATQRSFGRNAAPVPGLFGGLSPVCAGLTTDPSVWRNGTYSEPAGDSYYLLFLIAALGLSIRLDYFLFLASSHLDH